MTDGGLNVWAALANQEWLPDGSHFILSYRVIETPKNYFSEQLFATVLMSATSISFCCGAVPA